MPDQKTPIKPSREAKIKATVANRQHDLTVILENVHDVHNISAVIRSCEAVGIKEIFVIWTQDDRPHVSLGQRSSAGSRKWLDVHVFRSVAQCFEYVRERYESIEVASLGPKSRDMHELDMTASLALLFGNEHQGASQEAIDLSDGQFIISQYGMVQSLNISVSCAVTIFEAMRQRKQADKYTPQRQWNPETDQPLLDDYLNRHYTQAKGSLAIIHKKVE